MSSDDLQTRLTGIAKALRPVEGVLLLLIMVDFFVVLALLLLHIGLTHGVVTVASGTPDQFAGRVSHLVSDGLLAVIVLEIIETVRQQVEEKEKIYFPLARNFLVIGILSAVRQLLAIGALLLEEQGALEPDTFRLRMLELGVNAGIVLVLVLALLILRQTRGPSLSVWKDPEE
jgi:hypothetical protein